MKICKYDYQKLILSSSYHCKYSHFLLHSAGNLALSSRITRLARLITILEYLLIFDVPEKYFDFKEVKYNLAQVDCSSLRVNC